MSINIKDEFDDYLSLATNESNDFLVMEIIDKDKEGVLRFDKSKPLHRVELTKMVNFINKWLSINTQ